MQERTFGLKLSEAETSSVVRVIKEENTSSDALVVPSVSGELGLNEQGFKRLVVMFVLQVGDRGPMRVAC